jgi:threonine dehydratase
MMDHSEQPDAGFISSLINEAYDRIQSNLILTPLKVDLDQGLWLKCENLQTTGSFKWRGALSKLSALPPGSNIVTASTGNHGLGVAKAGALYGHSVKVFIPKTAASQKKEKLVALGVDLVQVDGDSLSAEMAGKQYAEENGSAWVSPYNDTDVIAGQGTIGLEILNQIDHIERLYITVGGGGLISGIACYVKKHSPHTEIIGCQPVNSPEMYLSQLAGHVVMAPEALPTLSDGSAGPLEEDSITFDLCRNLVDRYILVSEDDIRKAIRDVYHDHQMVIEGAAGVAYAAARYDDERNRSDNVVVVLCGGNIDSIIHKEICQ